MRRSLIVMSSLAILSACGDDATTLLDTSDLSMAEIEALFTELGGALSGLGSASAAPPPSQSGVSAAPIDFEVAIDQTVPCDTGTMALAGSSDGTADSESGAFDFRFDFRWGFSGCVIDSAEAGTVFTLNSAPGIDYIADVAFDPAASTITASGSQRGGVRIQTADGRDGTCVFDATYSATTNTSTGAATVAVSGTVCGVDVDQIASYSVVTGA